MTDVVDDLLETWASIESVAAELQPAEWELPTDLPAWSVRDLVSHMAAIEAYLLQRDEPDHEVALGEHVRNPLGMWNEQRVDRRRSWPAAAVLAEFREVTAERSAVLRALTPAQRAEMVFTPMGDMPLEGFLQIRVLDSWLHEQEIRRATGRPETLDTGAALRVLDMLLGWLPRAAAKAGVPDGEAAFVEVTAPVVRRAAALVQQGRGMPAGQDVAAAVGIRGPAGPFIRAATGRMSPAEAIGGGALEVRGEPALAERLLVHLNRVP